MSRFVIGLVLALTLAGCEAVPISNVDRVSLSEAKSAWFSRHHGRTPTGDKVTDKGVVQLDSGTTDSYYTDYQGHVVNGGYYWVSIGYPLLPGYDTAIARTERDGVAFYVVEFINYLYDDPDYGYSVSN